MIMTNYRTIARLKDGGHKIFRIDVGQVAHIVTEFKKLKRQLFPKDVDINVHGETLTLNDVSSLLFINEWTGEKLNLA